MNERAGKRGERVLRRHRGRTDRVTALCGIKYEETGDAVRRTHRNMGNTARTTLERRIGVHEGSESE